MLLRLNQQELRHARKQEKETERQKRISEGTDALFGEGKGELVLGLGRGKPKVKKQSLKKKKSGILAISANEWVGQTVDIWTPR